MTTTAKPILFFATANDRDDRMRHLRNLAEEARQMQRVQAAAELRGHGQLEPRPNVTAGDIVTGSPSTAARLRARNSRSCTLDSTVNRHIIALSIVC